MAQVAEIPQRIDRITLVSAIQSMEIYYYNSFYDTERELPLRQTLKTTYPLDFAVYEFRDYVECLMTRNDADIVRHSFRRQFYTDETKSIFVQINMQ